MGKGKTKAFQTNGTFRDNQACPGYIRAYLEPCLTLKYLELRYIQNANTFLTRNVFRNLVYSETCLTFTMNRFAKNMIIFNKNFHKK